MTTTPRARRTLSAVLVVLAMTSCSSGDKTPEAGTTATSPSTPSPTAGSANADALVRSAVAATSALKSYAFTSIQNVGATKPVRTVLTGTANRPEALSYTLTAGGKRTQVIRVKGATYLRVLPATWSKLKKPSTALDPGASLVALLRAIRQPVGTAPTVQGIIPAGSARAAGLPSGSGDATVTLTLDGAQHVVALDLTTLVERASGAPVKVNLHTTFASFNHVARIVAPV